jgi:hypothetical protein
MARERTTINAEHYEDMVRYAITTANEARSDIHRLHATLHNHGLQAAAFDAISYLNARDEAAGNIQVMIQDLEEMLPEEEVFDNDAQLEQYGLEALATQAQHEQYLGIHAINTLRYALELLESSTRMENPMLPVFLHAEQQRRDGAEFAQAQAVSDENATNTDQDLDRELDLINQAMFHMDMAPMGCDDSM